ncbi:thiamine-binding protein [Bacillus timonensis]|nr:thiamine-binding protein [Bacillus timonensis]
MLTTVNLGFQVLPKVANGNTYEVVDKAIEVVQKSGVKYEVGAMETVMEGELDQLLEIVKAAQDACITAGATEVMTHMKIHYRPIEGVTIDEKLHKYR